MAGREGQKHRGGQKRPGHREQRDGQSETAGKAAVDGNNGAEAGTRGDADDAGIGQRIAQKPLQRRPGQAEGRSNRDADQRPGQTNFAHDHGKGIVVGPGDQGCHRLEGRQVGRPHRQLDHQGQPQHEKENAGKTEIAGHGVAPVMVTCR